MKKPYKVRSREEGRGKVYTTSFATLEQAQTYIRDRWQGPDYIDGRDCFHTDYSTYSLVGFTLNDIGKTTWEGESPYLYRAYAFTDLNPKAVVDGGNNEVTEIGDGMFVPVARPPTIKSANVGPYPRPMPEGMFDPMPNVTVTYEDGTTEILFSFYPDEINFNASEFTGKTREEALALRHTKDTNYLRS